MKADKRFRIIESRWHPYMMKNITHDYEGTLQELTEKFSYTLETGASYQHERGNKKINRNPKSIESLVNNIYNAKNNASGNGYAGYSYRWEAIN